MTVSDSPHGQIDLETTLTPRIGKLDGTLEVQVLATRSLGDEPTCEPFDLAAIRYSVARSSITETEGDAEQAPTQQKLPLPVQTRRGRPRTVKP